MSGLERSGLKSSVPILYSGTFVAGPFEAGPFKARPYVRGPFEAGPFEAGRFVGELVVSTSILHHTCLREFGFSGGFTFMCCPFSSVALVVEFVLSFARTEP
jgi:hypothetical protein